MFRRLSVLRLDDRITPAVANYAAGTLTLTPASGAVLHVGPKVVNNTFVTGFVAVDLGGTPLFESSPAQPVKAVVVKPPLSTKGYTLEFLDGVSLSTLSITGAMDSTKVDIDDGVHVARAFTFTGTGTGKDTLTLHAKTDIGGNATIDLKGGDNVLNIEGGVIDGNLMVKGGAGSDDVELCVGSDLTVGRARFSLGDGTNFLDGAGPHSFWVGKGLTYTGGTGSDYVDFVGKVTPLSVGGSLAIALGDAPANGANYWSTRGLSVAGSVVVAGGPQADNVYFGGITSVGGSLSANLGDGTNDLGIVTADVTASAVVNGNVSYVGGAGNDEVDLDHLTVGSNLSLNIGAGSLGLVRLGVFQDNAVAINGNVTITGTGVDYWNLCRTHIGGNLAVFTGDLDDIIQLDDTTVAGSAKFDLGGGADQLDLDTLAKLNQLPFSGEVHIGGTLTVDAGAGDDKLDFSDLTGNRVVVGGDVNLVGGAGQDTFKHWQSGNVYLGTTFEDFELGESF